MSDAEQQPTVEQTTVETDKTKIPDTWFWIRDTQGYGSVTVTFVTVAFWVTTLAYVLSIFQKIGGIEIRQFDVAACSAYFIPILTLYFGRKYTEAKHGTLTMPPTDKDKHKK